MEDKIETTQYEDHDSLDTNVEEDTTSQDDIPTRYNISSYGWDTDVEGLVKRIVRKDIVIPSFQRRFVWTKVEQSRFVESLILGLPVPSLFLATDPETKKMSIIDGQQRLMSLVRFFSGELALSGKDIQEELKGKRYKTPEGKKSVKLLSEEDKRSIENALIHAVVIKQAESVPEGGDYTDELIQIFKRLNTSGKALQPQEIRSCVFPGPLNDMLGELNQNDDWRRIFGEEHSRLKDMEAILRVIALHEWLSDYKPAMPKFLNKYMKSNRFISEDKSKKVSEQFSKTIKVLRESLGEDAFRSGSTFLLSRFDCVFCAVYKILSENKTVDPQRLKMQFDSLLNDEYYQLAVSEFVNDKDKIDSRFAKAYELIQG